MRWWHKLIGRDDKFFDLLNSAAREVRVSVGLLATYLESRHVGGPPPSLAEFAESRRREKQIRTEMIDELYKALVPPFDREDIQALAFALYRIPKVVEKLVERLAIYPGRIPHEAFQKQVELLTIAADAIVFMVQHLYPGAELQPITDANARLQAAEGEADKRMLEILRELYASPLSQKEIVILQSLFELMERAIDRCRTAGNIIVRIMLKSV